MRDYISLGSTPCDEACAQVGSWDYSERMRVESRAFIGQLRRMFGPEPEGARLRVKGFAHDFGTYHEVVCEYDDAIPSSVAYAFRCEREIPDRWDGIAQREVAAYLPIDGDG